MSKIDIGDYIIGTDCVWEIIHKYEMNGIPMYDIKIMQQPADFLEDSEDFGNNANSKNPVIFGISLKYLRSLGEVVPKNSEKAIKALFEK